jgi:hypothetical protein
LGEPYLYVSKITRQGGLYPALNKEKSRNNKYTK